MDSPKPLELVFAKKDGLDIYMDVYIPDSATEASPAPAVLWWHGGGLLQVFPASPHQLSSPAKHGICFISADYRLAPQTRLPGILADCKSAIDFIRSDEFAAATGNRVGSKLILSGSSAGGWLALLAGSGIGYLESGLEIPSPVTGLSYFGRIIAREEVAPFNDPNGPKVVSSALDSKRSIFYPYMVQEAILSSLLLDNTDIPASAFNISSGIRSGAFTLPPTCITHGSIDESVPPSQAIDVVKSMEEKGLAVRFEYLEGLDHLFDRNPVCEMENMYAFMKELF
ncbi:Alpha/Beta hydrolase protein [Mycena floridula]|nr:Alpha/Beta hydrolase protein [Mycena floridula]